MPRTQLLVSTVTVVLTVLLVVLAVIGAARELLLVVGVVLVPLAVVDEVLTRRRLHEAVGLGHLGLREAGDVLRAARRGPLPADPAARAEAARLLEVRGRYLGRSRRHHVVALVLLVAVGAVLVAVDQGWALTLVGVGVGAVLGRWFDASGTDQRVERLRSAPPT